VAVKDRSDFFRKPIEKPGYLFFDILFLIYGLVKCVFLTTWKACQTKLKIKNIKMCMIRANYVKINRIIQKY
jgi:hypothetical protein